MHAAPIKLEQHGLRGEKVPLLIPESHESMSETDGFYIALMFLLHVKIMITHGLCTALISDCIKLQQNMKYVTTVKLPLILPIT